MTSGKEKAWKTLNNLNPLKVCKNAAVAYDSENCGYTLRSFDMDFLISPEKRIITNISPEGEKLIKRYSYFFNLLALYYLINAKDIPLSGRPVKPENIQSGAVFFRGAHILPLDQIAEKYNNDKIGFIEKGKEFSGRIVSYGDASIELLPMPRIPVTLILWLSDDEFPARADLLFDSTCELQAPIDILWSVAMLSVLVML
ncbi:MAG: DUF3786 domain-containing protein [Nitrospirae bacterium]|nr:DUF3786 domain-containing protein [Nitrospirota bacterium]